MYQQLWGYKVEEKLYLGVREQKRLNTTALLNVNVKLYRVFVNLKLQIGQKVSAHCLATVVLRIRWDYDSVEMQLLTHLLMHCRPRLFNGYRACYWTQCSRVQTQPMTKGF
jgi:hypothetical protein